MTFGCKTNYAVVDCKTNYAKRFVYYLADDFILQTYMIIMLNMPLAERFLELADCCALNYFEIAYKVVV